MKIPAHRRHTLANGTRLILLPRHEVPLIAFEAVMRGGARLDSPSRAGLAAVSAALLTRGAAGRDAHAFAEAVEGAGGSLEADAHSEAIALHGQFLARDRELMLELLSDGLQRPRFEASELDIVCTRRIEFIKAAKDSEPQSLIGLYGRALLFADHPFGKPVGGSESSLACLTRADVLGFYRDHIGADRLTLVFAGDFDPDWMLEAVTAAFGSWGVARELLSPLSAPPRVQGRNVLLIDAPDSTQTYFWIGNTGVARSYPQRAALEITNTAFGGSFGSMLMQALRVKSGLTYSVSSNFRRGTVPADFAINSFTRAESTGEALDLALNTLSTLKREGAGERSLASARNYILGQYPLGFETAADWASALAELDLYELPESYIDEFAHSLHSVDAAASQRVVENAYPDAADVEIVLIGDAARIRADAARLGPVREKSLAAPDFYAPAA